MTSSTDISLSAGRYFFEVVLITSMIGRTLKNRSPSVAVLMSVKWVENITASNVSLLIFSVTKLEQVSGHSSTGKFEIMCFK